MSHADVLRGAPLVRREREGRSPSITLIWAYIIGLLLLSPAILGLYWEWLLP